MKNNEAKDLIGCCGLYCGLCAKYQLKAPSRGWLQIEGTARLDQILM